jgi:hypothetical protein
MTDRVYIQIDNERIEATGDALDYVLQSQAKIQKQITDEEAERKTKALARESALAKLAKLGLTQAEIDAL